MFASKLAPFARALATAAALTALTVGAALACDCDGDYGDHHRHDGYGTGNYSCYGGFHDCRYESDGGYYYHDDYRYDGYRYDGHRYDERDRHFDRDYRDRDYRR